MLSDTQLPANPAESHAEAYVYPAPLSSGVGAKPPAPGASSSTLERLFTAEVAPPAPPAPPPIPEEQIRAREARARKEGNAEGAAQARGEFEKKLGAEKQNLAQALRDFAAARESYFQRVEAEVVALALAIARKILHREAQVDPLLLAGVVRVGLENVAAGTHVRLCVHPDQVPVWRQFFASQPDLRLLPELVGDASLQPGRCMLETELGSTDLTLEIQLKEIEQGFFDLLAQKPGKPA